MGEEAWEGREVRETLWWVEPRLGRRDVLDEGGE